MYFIIYHHPPATIGAPSRPSEHRVRFPKVRAKCVLCEKVEPLGAAAGTIPVPFGSTGVSRDYKSKKLIIFQEDFVKRDMK
jgi:hypothetical protein